MPAGAHRILLVGYGAIGRRHARVLRQLAPTGSGAEVVAVVDPDADARAAAVADGYVAFDLIETALAATQPSIAAICSPNGLHAAQATAALGAGLHVVIEKPVGIQSSDLAELQRAHAASDRLAVVMVQNRWSAPVSWLKALVEAGGLGRPLMVQISCIWNRDLRYYAPTRSITWRGDNQLDGGVLFTQFSHFIDLLVWLWGPPTPLQATLRNLTHPTLPFPDSGIATLELPGGGLCGINFSTSATGTNAENRIVIVAERGSLVLSGQYFEQLEAVHLPGIELPAVAPPADKEAGHRAVWADVLSAVATGPPYPDALTATFSDALVVVDVINAIHRLGASHSGQR